MCYRLRALASRVTELVLATGERRAIRGSEKAVLLAIADSVLPRHVDRSWITMRNLPATWIEEERLGLIAMTSYSIRTIQGAIRRLCVSRHISRVERRGRGVEYHVHPQTDVARLAPASPEELAENRPTMPCSQWDGSARAPGRRTVAPPPPTPDATIDAAIAAWNAEAERTAGADGLPGLLPCRELAGEDRAELRAMLAEPNGPATFQAAAARAGRSAFCRGGGDRKRRAGIVFAFRARYRVPLLEGRYDGPAPELARLEPKAAAPPPEVRIADDDPAAAVRRALVEEVGERAYVAWLQPCTIALDGDAILVGAPTPFMADYLRSRMTHEIRGAALGATGRVLEVMIVTDTTKRPPASSNG